MIYTIDQIVKMFKSFTVQRSLHFGWKYHVIKPAFNDHLPIFTTYISHCVVFVDRFDCSLFSAHCFFPMLKCDSLSFQTELLRYHIVLYFQLYFYDVISPAGTIMAPRGIATDMGTLDSAYFLSQVVLSCIMGYIVYMTGSVLSYMVTAGVMGVCSLYFIQNIITTQQELQNVRQMKPIL